MRILRAVLVLAAIAAGVSFVWALFAPRRKTTEAPAAVYVAPPPADDHEVSVAEALPLDAPAG